MNSYRDMDGPVGLSKVVGTALVSPPPQAFAAIDEALDRVAVLARRVSELADILCGPEAVPDESGHASNPERPGVFVNLERRANWASRQVGDAQAQMDRIYACLPQ